MRTPDKKNDGKLRVLFVGDASNCHCSLAEELRREGHEAMVASNGTFWMETERDMDLRRRLPGKFGGLDLWLRLNTGLLRKMRGYDVVALASQSFIDLKPCRQRYVYDFLRRNNRAVFYTSLGTDPAFVEECIDPSSPIRYSEFSLFGEDSPYVKACTTIIDEWLAPAPLALNRHIYDTVDGAMPVLYEYDVALRRVLSDEKIGYTGIPIDTEALRPVVLPERIEKVRLFLGRHRDRMLIKGTDILECAAKEIVSRYPGRAELVIVENRPYREYIELLKSAHVVLDQIYSYTPATNALLAMAYGLNTVSGGAEEFYDFIGERELRPVIHVEPDYDSVCKALENTVLHPELIRPRGLEGREFVVKHNDSRVVACRSLDFWRSRIEAKEGGEKC